MPIPSIFPMFLKQGAGSLVGTVFIETFGVEILETVNIEVIELVPDVEVVEVVDVEVVEDAIEVEIPC
jgi:hypothetical protein